MENVKKKNAFIRLINFISERINQIDIPDDRGRFDELDKGEIKFVEKLDEMDNVEQIEIEHKERIGLLEGRAALKARYNEKVDTVKARNNARKAVKNQSQKTIESK